MKDETIFETVRRAQRMYVYENVQMGKYVNWSMYDTLQTIDAYLNSVHTSGKTDSLGREKPFFNIVTAATNIWYRATDIDRKDIRIKPTCNDEVVPAFLATIHLQEWMKREKFGMFLNLWGRSLSRYGSSVVKFVKQEGRLIPSVIPWNRLVVDPVDFYALPVIERLFKTPAQLRQTKAYDQDAVEQLIESHNASRKTLDNQKVDNKSEFIEIYEVHGELPLCLITEKEDDDETYRQQMHVISFVAKRDAKNEYDEFSLFKGKEEKSPYLITHLIEEDGRTLSIGAVEYLFDAQWMMNNTMKQQRDYLELASKLIFQTSDQNFVGRNVLSAVESGDILVYSQNNPLTQVNNTVGNITALESYGAQWLSISRELTSTPDAVRGNTLPSGTPYSLGAILTQNASSLFELMTENKGLEIEEMCREFIIPFLKTKMDTSEEIMATLDEQGITQIDALYVPREAVKRYNDKAIGEILNGKLAPQFDPIAAQSQVKQDLSSMGNMRPIKPSDISTKTWKDIFTDLEWEVEVEVTNETQDKQAVLQSLSTVLQTIAANPAILQDPNGKLVFGKIMNTVGAVSPLELSTAKSPPQMMPGMTPSPMVGGVGQPRQTAQPTQ